MIEKLWSCSKQADARCTFRYQPALMCWALLILLLLSSSLATPGASILREVWLNIDGNEISRLTSDPRYPNEPSFTTQQTELFEAPVDFAERYGQRMHGYILPPATGNYIFWISSDDNGELWLSTDEDPANRRIIARVNGWTNSREWNREPNQMSEPIFLEAGRAYYVAALQKEGGGGDNLAVGWQRPDGTLERPIPATHLYPWGTAFKPPSVLEHPQDTTAVEGQLATFTLRVDPLSPSEIQWQQNGINIPGATNLTLNHGPVALVESGSTFRAVLTNRLGGAVSNPARLSVTPDLTRPQLERVYNPGLNTRIVVVFSEPVEVISATSPENYRLDNEASVLSARTGQDSRTVELTTSPLTYHGQYVLTVSGVKDRAATPNTITANTTFQFTVFEYAPAPIGNAQGSGVSVAGGLDLTGTGQDIGGKTDDFQFAYQERTGDFDIQARLEDLTISDPWVQAGLLLRESLTPNARFAGVFASSAQVGCFFESRATSGMESSIVAPPGGFPVNYPKMYLRLRRSGSFLSGFASFDGIRWQPLGSVSMSLPAKVFVGLGVASHNADLPATARFRDVQSVQSTSVFTHTPTREPLGPSNRRTGLIFSEIMYHPPAREETNNFEYVEIYNAGTLFVDMSGWRLSGGISYAFPEGFKLQAGAFVVVAADPAVIQQAYGITNLLGPFLGKLDNAGDAVLLLNRAGAVRLEVEYNDKSPWPISADGGGHSLVLAQPSYGENDPRAWAASAQIGGSPGQVDPIVGNSWQGLMINEFLAHTDDPQLDFVEIYNASNLDVPIGGCILTDNPSTNRYRFPANTTLRARSFLALDQNALGFALSSAGEIIYLISPDGSRVLDAIQFGGQENGISSGRAPDGSPTIRRLTSPTPGASNAPWKIEDVVINEIMYHPISGEDNEQFVEIHNRSSQSVDLSGWRFVSGIDFEFPEGSALPGGGYAVVARDLNALQRIYTNLTSDQLFGNFDGRLSRRGERLALAKRDFVQATNEFGLVETNAIYITISEVTYVDGGRWSELADGGGSSLELIDSRADTLRASNWQPSDESRKSQWTSVEVTAPLQHGNTDRAANRFYIVMQGAGECLVDDVEIFRPGGPNLLANAGFESGLNGWTPFGNHSRSAIMVNEAFSGNRSLAVRAPGDGDPANNTIRANLSTTLNAGETITIRAKVRWLSGWPEVLFRVRGNWIELPARMQLPLALGTPGQANSRRIPNAGPAIFDVTHTPALPRANETVRITARVTDPDGVATPRVRYRIDPSGSPQVLSMRDDGLGGDTLAGDGVYTATLPGRPQGTLVVFRIEASDDAAFSASSIFPHDAPTRECHIRWGDPIPFGTFGHHHLWNAQATEAQFNQSPGLDNTFRDATLVYGNFRVIYNASFRHKGSPYHGGTGDFAATVPKDDMLLGIDDRIYASTGNGGAEATNIRTDLSGWVGEQLGIPFLHSHFVRLFRNGNQFREILLDLEQPNRYYAESWFGGGDIKDDLYKIAVWFEFDDNNSSFSATGATLRQFLPNGKYNLGRYRWNWQIRPSGSTANDLSSLFELVAAANSSTERTRRLPQLADMEEWMRVIAYNGLLGNWDAWTFSVGQNMFLYTPLGYPARLLPWDIDFVLGVGSGATSELWGGQDPVMSQLFGLPLYQRMLYRAYQDGANGPFQPTNYLPQIEARRAALLKNGVPGSAETSGIASYMDARRDYVLSQIRARDTSAFQITSNNGNDFTSANPVVALTGTAPIAGATIEVNGIPYPVTWTALTTWRIEVPLGSGANRLEITAKDLRGKPLPGGTDIITIQFQGTAPDIRDWVVINEIMYNAAFPDGDYVELHNRHPNYRFDLSGIQLAGVDFVFPPGSLIEPNGFLVVVENTAAFAAAYGTGLPVTGPYNGRLQNGGENLRLLDLSGPQPVLIDEVRYDSQLPWPPQANGLGPSLQLVDPSQDNWRVGNWAVTTENDPNRATPGRPNANRSVLSPFPSIWINEVLPNNASGALDNRGEREPWIELYNSGPTAVDLGGLLLSDDPANLTKWQIPPGVSLLPGNFLLVWSDGEPAESTAQSLHTSFRLHPTSGVVLLSRSQPTGPVVIDYLRYTLSSADLAYGSYPDGDPRRRRVLHVLTPGAKNDPTIPSLKVFINEWMASNGSVLRDPADGQFEDWFELHNAGTNTVDLSGFYLTDNLSRPTMFTIPVGTAIPPGGFLLVWADNEPAQNGPGRDLHVNFALSANGEELGLFTPDEQLVHGLSFGGQTRNISEGRFPDGGEPPFAFFSAPTPGGPNTAQFANQPPSIEAINDFTINEGETVSIQVVASDPDIDQTVSYSLVESPEGASITSSGRLTWTTGEAEGPGLFRFTVRVSDNGTPVRAVSRSFRVEVQEVNLPPSISPIAELIIDEGSLLQFQIPASDPDRPGQSLRYSITTSTAVGALIDPTTGDFSWQTAEEHGPGQYEVTVEVADDGMPPLTASQTFRIIVSEINNPPLISALGPFSINEQEPFSAQVLASDTDNPPVSLTFALIEPPAGVSIHPTSGLISWTPDESQGPRDYAITVRVSEPGGSPFSTLSILVGVKEVNTAPTLNAIPDFVLRPSERLLFTTVATDRDLPAQTLSFTATGLPLGAALDQRTGVLDWLVPEDPQLGTNEVTLTVTDDGSPALTSRQSFRIVVNGTFRVAINEIMHRPAVPRAEFVELYNYSTANRVDLSGWNLEGYSFTFPPGTELQPGGILVVARDLSAFRTAYGSNLNALGDAAMSLDANGGEIRLLRPRAPGLPMELIDSVSFSLEAPWPDAASSQGASLQLIDVNEDHRRVGNWSSSVGNKTNPPVEIMPITGTWKYHQNGDPGTDWKSPGFVDTAWPSGDALLYVEGSSLPAPKNTPLTLGQSAYYFRSRFNFNGNPEGAVLSIRTIIDDAAAFYMNGQPLFRLGMGDGLITHSTYANRVQDNAVIEGPFRIPAESLRKGENVLAVEVHQANANSSDIVFGAEFQLITVSPASFTPGAPNSTIMDLPPFPSLYITEVLPNNSTGITDNFGEREPWVELYNAGPEPVSLNGWFLTDSYASLAKWPFPGATVIAPNRYLLVWADGETSEISGTHLHTNFRLNPSSGIVALTRNQNGSPAVVDYLAYNVPGPDTSFGSFLDHAPWQRAVLSRVTPGEPNRVPAEPARITALRTAQGLLQISWSSAPGTVYELQTTENLLQPNWVTIYQVLSQGSSETFTDPESARKVSRFYRVKH